MEQILHSKKLNEQYHNIGYVKFPLFDKDEIMEIKSFYNKIKKDHNIEDRCFHTTMNTSNRNLIDKVNDFLLPYFTRHLPKHLKNYNLTIAGFLIKDPGKQSAVTIHQDLTYVDESRFTSFNLWVSLTDTHLLNGSMQFIPGSHKFYPSLRTSPDIESYFHSFKDKAAEYLVDVPSKAGECVMFNQALIHASRKNVQNQRPTCIVSGYSKDAEMLHHFIPIGEPLSKIEQHKISIKSMIEMKKNQRPPHSEFLGYVNYEPPKVSFEEFEQKCLTFVSPYYKYRNKIVNYFLGKSS